MNIKQLTEAVAQGANPLAVINAAIREGVGTSYFKQPIRTRQDIGAQPKLGNKVAPLDHIQPHHLVDGSHTGQGWAVHMDRSVVAPGTSYTSSAAHSPQFKEYMRAAGIPHLVDQAGSHGYDDVTFDFKDREHAHQVARALNSVIPGPSKSYRDDYMPDSKAHHAQVVKYDYSDGCPDGGDAVEESIEEGKPSGISRAWDQPDRTAAKKARFDQDMEYYSSPRSGYSSDFVAQRRATGPERDYKTTHDREKFIGRYSQDSKLPKTAADRAAGKSYKDLPPVLQRLVKKNVRAAAAEPKGSGYRRGPLAGKTGYQAYDLKHQAAAAVGFDPAPAFKHDVAAGHKIDPAVNQRAKDHDEFKSALDAMGVSSNPRNAGQNKFGAQHGKRVKTGGSSYSPTYSDITHVHHPEHGEIQLFTPDNAKEEPTVYHRPAGSARGKMHKWSSPEAQAVVSRVMNSGEGWPKG